jgi:CBS domain-containing protein
MNILFFLTPKANVAYVESTDSLRQVLEKMEHHGYTAIPMLSEEGKYLGTITEGDLLWEMKEKDFPNLYEMEDIKITEVERRRDNQAVNIEVSMENLFEKVKNQNFVPVVDDEQVFIGIVTRKDILMYLTGKLRSQNI